MNFHRRSYLVSVNEGNIERNLKYRDYKVAVRATYTRFNSQLHLPSESYVGQMRLVQGLIAIRVVEKHGNCLYCE